MLRWRKHQFGLTSQAYGPDDAGHHQKHGGPLLERRLGQARLGATGMPFSGPRGG
jgi:hypothetical protein